MSILTLAEYKTFAGINSPNKDDELSTFIDMVNDFIPLYCNLNFSSTAVTGYRTTLISGEIILPNTFVTSIEEISIKASGVVVDPSDIILEADQGIAILTGVYLNSDSVDYGILVNYTHGRVTVPYDLKLAAMELVSYYNKREFAEARSMGNETSDYASPKQIPIQVLAIFNLHKVL